ncbi:unnamed protein product, partial [Mesorhabditis belari]|uniref:Secreted protein n=1 Tax=Mesorhabditis belari TaxID=2138241 RepID=A0AAF3FAY1_9BILA
MSLLSSCLALLFAVLLAFASVSMVNADPVPLCNLARKNLRTTNLKTNCGGWVMTAASCVRKNVRWYYYLSYRYKLKVKRLAFGNMVTSLFLELETDIDTSDDFGRRVCLEARGLTLKEPMIAFGMGDGEKAKYKRPFYALTVLMSKTPSEIPEARLLQNMARLGTKWK